MDAFDGFIIGCFFILITYGVVDAIISSPDEIFFEDYCEAEGFGEYDLKKADEGGYYLVCSEIIEPVIEKPIIKGVKGKTYFERGDCDGC